MPDVTVHPIKRAERRVIENLWQLYVHDFSELWAGETRAELDPDGRWGLEPIREYWADANCTPHLIRVDGHLAGFALINKTAHSGRSCDWSVAEFFVVRKHRTAGAGRAAAHALFATRPGQWEATIARKNLRALSFWRGAVASCPGVSDVEETDQSDSHWNGPVLRFRVG